MEENVVRMMKTELHHFKNVNYGDVRYVNYSSLNKDGSIQEPDILGIYGQNGSGKTALVEALDCQRRVLAGDPLPYEEFAGLLPEDAPTTVVTMFHIRMEGGEYKARYQFTMSVDPSQKINILNESIIYWSKGAAWKSRRELDITNGYYEKEDFLAVDGAVISSEPRSALQGVVEMPQMDIAVAMAAEAHTSVLMSNRFLRTVRTLGESDQEATRLSNVLSALHHFACAQMNVIKVAQLGEINRNTIVPLNVFQTTNNGSIQGALPLFVNGSVEIPMDFYDLLSRSIHAINIALRAIVPDLQIEMEQKSVNDRPDGVRTVSVEAYSRRGDRRFLIRYESEGIKRIISILNYLIAAYNDPSICLVVDELDSGIFEYLLGELLGALDQDLKGQLIFTSHNLRVLEKLGTQNIICSTSNPDNRYIRLSGVNRNNNKRDFYLRALTIGGQKEELYNDDDLQAIGYAFRKAGKISQEPIEIPLSEAVRIQIQKEGPAE